MNTDISSRLTLDRLLEIRADAMNKVLEAHRLLQDATNALQTFSNLLPQEVAKYVGQDGYPQYAVKLIDEHCWKYVLNHTSISLTMTSEQKIDLLREVKSSWFNRYQESPPFTEEVVMSLALRMVADQNKNMGGMVAHIYGHLYPTYKSNGNGQFGKKIIFHQYRNFYTMIPTDSWIIHDLDKVCCLINGEPPPYDYGGLVGEVNRCEEGEIIEYKWCKFKVFGNGNLHMWLNEEVIKQLNMWLNKHRKLLSGEQP